ncbi:hypothetical protein BJ912DRAFT_1064504 [Pholiota molesta]|nr:hypothetical protein BJ912DRAFT_1064504 [Pholiota molesta]
MGGHIQSQLGETRLLAPPHRRPTQTALAAAKPLGRVQRFPTSRSQLPRTLAPTDSLPSRCLSNPDAHPPTLLRNPKPLPTRLVRPVARRTLRESAQRSRQWGRRPHGPLGTYQTRSRTSCTRIAAKGGWTRRIAPLLRRTTAIGCVWGAANAIEG